MLSEAGADLIPISTTKKIQSSQKLDEIDALYIGGGFPEMNLPELVSNNEMKDKIKQSKEFQEMQDPGIYDVEGKTPSEEDEPPF